LLFDAARGTIVVSHQSEWIANSLKERDMKRSSAGTKRQCDKKKPAGSKANPEVVAFTAAVLRQMDHAANLVAAFFRSMSMLDGNGVTLSALPGQFLLELAALLQVREWHAAGVSPWADQDGVSIDDRIGQAIIRLRDDPTGVVGGRRGSEAVVAVLRHWNESCCPAARAHLGSDVALHWDSRLDVDQIIDVFADFLCRHRNAPHKTEVK
jgi:hypothetical protein